MERFASISEEEINNILREKDSTNTKKATSVAWNTFLQYCKEKDFGIDFGNETKENINEILKKFYVEV